MPLVALQAMQDQVRAAAAAGTPLCITGAGTRQFLGRPVEGAALVTRHYRDVIDYEPTELVLSARAGTPLADIETLLAERNQMLAFEPPRFAAAGAPGAPGGTLGGAIAAGLAGPRRMAVGGVRDFILGAKLLDGKGEVLRFGGQVMKNVAGYDVARLLAGSLGTLGVLLEISVKVLPRPAATRTLRFECSQGEALKRMHPAGALPLSASCWHAGQLTLRLCGAEVAVRAAVAQLGGEIVEPAAAQAWWTSLRDQTHPFFKSDQPLWRVAVPPTAPPLDLDAEPLLEWQGGQRWLRGEFDPATLRAAARGGHVTLFRARAALRAEVPVFTPLAAPAARIQRALKASFDPAGIFNPQRLYPDL